MSTKIDLDTKTETLFHVLECLLDSPFNNQFDFKVKAALNDLGLQYKDGAIVKTGRRISAEAKEALYDKPAWSEEDERICRAIVCDIANDKSICKFEISKSICDEQINWLKSLKDRIK